MLSALHCVLPRRSYGLSWRFLPLALLLAVLGLASIVQAQSSTLPQIPTGSRGTVPATDIEGQTSYGWTIYSPSGAQVDSGNDGQTGPNGWYVQPTNNSSHESTSAVVGPPTSAAIGNGYSWHEYTANDDTVGNFGVVSSTGGLPAAPMGLTATAGNASISLSWTTPGSSGLTYNVKRATISGGPYTTVSTAGAVTSTTYSDSGLTNGTTYYYVVTAVGSAGEGPASGEASATPTAPVADNAQFVSQSPPPSTIRAGQSYSVSVTMKNTGTSTWVPSASVNPNAVGAYQLLSENPYNNATWGVQTVNLPSSIAPGQSATFTFNVVAPAAPGSYNFQWQIIHQGIGVFGDLTPNIICANPADDARYVSSTFPVAMTAGQSYSGTLTMKNTGTSTWTDAAAVANGYNIEIPQGDPNTWGIAGIVFPTQGMTVAPGQSVTFSFTVTAPTAAGSYPLRYQMIHQNIAWFGDISSPVITVNAAQPPPSSTSLINDTDSSIVYSGSGWAYYSGRGLGDYQDDVHATSINGDSASYTFTGTGLSYITETNSDEGNVRVYIDGALQATVNCYSASRQAQQPVWSTSSLSSGSHTLKLVKLDGSCMLLDALQVISAMTAPQVTGLNLGFETPSLGSGSGAYTASPSGASWTFANGGGISGNGSAFTFQNAPAPEGSQVAFVQITGSISQSLAGFQAGTTYTLTVSAAQRVAYSGGTQVVQVSMDGTVLGTLTPSGSGYTDYSFSYTPQASGAHTLQFLGLNPNGGDNTVFLDNVRLSATTASQTQVLAINAGGGAAGSFLADTDYDTGNTYTVSTTIDTSGVTNPAPQAVYQTERWGNFTYTLPGLTPGASYTLRLHFAETSVTGAGQRIFSVAANGNQILTNFDIFAAAGGVNKAVAESFPVTASSSGQIIVQFIQGAQNNPKVDGLEVLNAGTAGSGSPVPVPGLFPTGVDNSGNVLADGASDPHYAITSGPDGAGAAAHVTLSSQYPFGSASYNWISDSTASKWISPQGDQNASPEPPGAYVYRTTFDLTNFNAASVQMSGRMLVDDQVTDVRLNGVSLGITAPYNTWTPLSITSGFVSGLNTLDFLVTNGGSSNNPSGLRVELSGTGTAVSAAQTIAVSPASPALNTGGTQQFTAVAKDQSGNPLSPQPAFTWSVVSGGVGTISSSGLYSAGATAGSATVRATSGSGSGSATVTVTVPPAPSQPTPYGGAPVTITSSGTTKVEAENYDLGGEGVAYHDVDNGGSTLYRSDNVGIDGISSASNGYGVGSTAGGEWDGYTISVASAGVYTLSTSVSSPTPSGTFHLEFGPVGQVGGSGIIQSGEFTVPNTGSYTSFQSVTVPGVSLPAGRLWMRLVLDSAYPCIFDYFTFSVSAPSAPMGLTATAGNAGAALSWTAPGGSGLTYNIKRATTSGGPYITVGSSGTTSYLDSGLTNGTTYYYVVTAVSSTGESGISNQAAVTPSATALLAPMLSAQATSSTQVTLTWTAVSGASSYNLYRSTTPGGEGSTAYKSGITPQGFNITYQDTVPAGTTTYYYKAVGVGSSGSGAFSNEASATPGAAVLSAPLLKGVAGNSQVTLTWSAVTGAASYNLYRATSRGYPATLYKTGLTVASLTDTGLTNSTAYTYYVTAVATSGEGSQSNQVALTPGSPALPAPLLSAQATSSTQITVSWSPVPGASNYNLYRSTTAGGEGNIPYKVNVTPQGPNLAYLDTVPTGTATYYYELVAVGPGGEGTFSNEVSATPGVTPLAPPKLKGVAAATQNTLTWSAVTGAASYNVYRFANQGSPYSALYKTGITANTFADTGMTSGTAYTYYVTAVATSGEGSQSNQVALTPGSPALPAPLLSAQATSSTSVTLTWSSVSNASSYNLYRSITAGGEGNIPYKVNVTPQGPNLAYLDTVPTGTATYYYELVAVGPGGEGTFSNEASATPGVSRLAAPTLTATADPTRVAINVSWSAVPGATSYNLYRPGTSQSGLYLVGLTSTSYADTNLLPSGSAVYFVTAVNKDGEGAASNTVPAQVNGFYITCPAMVTVNHGTTVAINLTMTPLGTFAGSVVLSGSATPAGTQGLFYPAAPFVNSAVDLGYSITGNLYLNVGAATAPGSYPITITGTANGFTNSIGLTLIVQ